MQKDLAKQKRLALVIGIVAQIRLAELEFSESISDYNNSRKIYEKRVAILEEMRKAEEEGAERGNNILFAENTALGAQLKMLESYSALQTSQERLRNSVGEGPNKNQKEWSAVGPNKFEPFRIPTISSEEKVSLEINRELALSGTPTHAEIKETRSADSGAGAINPALNIRKSVDRKSLKKIKSRNLKLPEEIEEELNAANWKIELDGTTANKKETLQKKDVAGKTREAVVSRKAKSLIDKDRQHFSLPTFTASAKSETPEKPVVVTDIDGSSKILHTIEKNLDQNPITEPDNIDKMLEKESVITAEKEDSVNKPAAKWEKAEVKETTHPEKMSTVEHASSPETMADDSVAVEEKPTAEIVKAAEPQKDLLLTDVQPEEITPVEKVVEKPEIVAVIEKDDIKDISSVKLPADKPQPLALTLPDAVITEEKPAEQEVIQTAEVNLKEKTVAESSIIAEKEVAISEIKEDIIIKPVFAKTEKSALSPTAAFSVKKDNTITDTIETLAAKEDKKIALSKAIALAPAKEKPVNAEQKSITTKEEALLIEKVFEKNTEEDNAADITVAENDALTEAEKIPAAENSIEKVALAQKEEIRPKQIFTNPVFTKAEIRKDSPSLSIARERELLIKDKVSAEPVITKEEIREESPILTSITLPEETQAEKPQTETEARITLSRAEIRTSPSTQNTIKEDSKPIAMSIDDAKIKLPVKKAEVRKSAAGNSMYNKKPLLSAIEKIGSPAKPAASKAEVKIYSAPVEIPEISPELETEENILKFSPLTRFVRKTPSSISSDKYQLVKVKRKPEAITLLPADLEKSRKAEVKSSDIYLAVNQLPEQKKTEKRRRLKSVHSITADRRSLKPSAEISIQPEARKADILGK